MNLSTNIARERPTFRVTLGILEGLLETYEAVVDLEGFPFDGFLHQGEAGTPIGSVSVDLDANGTVDYVLDILALDRNAAFVDVDGDRRFEPGVDGSLQHREGAQKFFLLLPLGGDANPRTVLTPHRLHTTITIFAGALTNPGLPGPYPIHVTAFSVDPNTDGANDARGRSPRRLSVDLAVAIVARPMTIDIKPDDSSNTVNPQSEGIIPLAILTTQRFDATSVDPTSAEFGPARATEAHGRGHTEDVDGDGDVDLVLHFKIMDAGIRCGQVSASLSAFTSSGQAVEGSDSIRTVGCR